MRRGPATKIIQDEHGKRFNNCVYRINYSRAARLNIDDGAWETLYIYLVCSTAYQLIMQEKLGELCHEECVLLARLTISDTEYKRGGGATCCYW